MRNFDELEPGGNFFEIGSFFNLYISRNCDISWLTDNFADHGVFGGLGDLDPDPFSHQLVGATLDQHLVVGLGVPNQRNLVVRHLGDQNVVFLPFSALKRQIT